MMMMRLGCKVNHKAPEQSLQRLKEGVDVGCGRWVDVKHTDLEDWFYNGDERENVCFSP